MVRKYVKYVMKVADQRLAEYVMKAQLLAIPPKTRMASILNGTSHLANLIVMTWSFSSVGKFLSR